jgi:hypothetical protein
VLIQCYVEDLRRTYANGLPRVEVFVSTGYTHLVRPMPNQGQRVPITVVTQNGTYQGGLRDNQGNGWPYICPDLFTASGSKISLAQILRASGVPLSPNQPLQFDLSGNTWTLL